MEQDSPYQLDAPFRRHIIKHSSSHIAQHVYVSPARAQPHDPPPIAGAGGPPLPTPAQIPSHIRRCSVVALSEHEPYLDLRLTNVLLSSLAASMSFDFMFPTIEPSSPPSFGFDPRLLEIPRQTAHQGQGHARSASHSSVYSQDSSPSTSDAVSVSTRMTTPARSPAPAPIRQHGPLLLPKIRSQDQDLDSAAPAVPVRAPKRVKTSPKPVPVARRSSSVARTMAGGFRPGHTRSFTNPEPISFNAGAAAFSFSGTPPPPSMSSSFSQSSDDGQTPTPASLMCSPVIFPEDSMTQSHQQQMVASNARRASSVGLDNGTIEKYGFPTYRQMPSYVPATSQAPSAEGFVFPTCTTTANSGMYTPRAPSPLCLAHQHQASPVPQQTLPFTPEASLEPQPTTTLLSYLGQPNPAPSLVRTLSFPLRDPNTRHFWWDVRQVRPWTAFNASTILSLPGASTLLSTPIPNSLLPVVPVQTRHPETEAALHAIYANHYVPRLNAALALSSTRPLQITSVMAGAGSAAAVKGAPAPQTKQNGEPIFTVTCPSTDAATSHHFAPLFGGKPSARVVGLVKSFDRWNSGMRAEGNVKRVEYLRGLAHLHHVMREHGTRYGFILTEIELVVVRNGSDRTPNFGWCEVAAVQLAESGNQDDEDEGDAEGERQPKDVKLTACLALWGLCMLASDDVVPPAHPAIAALGDFHPQHGVFGGQSTVQDTETSSASTIPVSWKAEIGAPAEGTRRKALPRDSWMPQPQLAEKREAKRSRGWVWPEDPIGRKELGKRGVKYGGC